MGRKAGAVTVTLSASTGQFALQLAQSKAQITSFGQVSRNSMAETSAFVKTIEGNFQGSQRAVSRFLAVTLGLGPVISAAFPIIGAVLLGKAIYDTAGKLHDFFKDLAQEPEKVRGAFRELNAPLEQTNAQLDLTNAKLENQIAKLTGHRENKVKEMLAEAVVEAEKLSESLDKDLKSLEKLLKEQSHNVFAQYFGASGAGKTAHKLLFEGEEGTESVKQQVDAINDVAKAKIAAAAKAKDPVAAENAELERQTELYKILGPIISKANVEIAKAQKAGSPTVVQPELLGHKRGEKFEIAPNMDPATAMTAINTWRGVIKFAEDIMAELPKLAEERKNKGIISALEAADEAKRRAAPWLNMLESLITNAKDAKRELDAVGLDEAGRLAAKSYSEAAKAIDRVNKEQLAQKGGVKIDEQKRNEVEMYKLATDQNKAIEEFRASEREALRGTIERIAATEMLTAAIGKGYEANKRAVVEGKLISEYKEKYNAPENQGEVGAARSRLLAEAESKHRLEIAQTIDKLNDQIAVEYKLADALSKDAWAVRQVEFAESQRQAAEKGANPEVLAKNLLDFALKRQNEVAKQIDLINQEIAATENLTAARFAGGEAEFRAQKETTRTKVLKETGSPSIAAATVAELEARHQQEISNRVADSLNLYKHQLELLQLQDNALKSIAVTAQNRLDIERLTRDLQNERLKILAEEALSMRTAQDGVRAFFLEMQADAKSSAAVVYEALHSALDRTSTEFSKLFTGQKTDFKKVFGDIGQNMLSESIKGAMQKGLGALGKALGIHGPEKRGDSPATPLYVWNVNPATGGQPSLSQIIIPGGNSGGGSQAGISRLPGVITNLLGLFGVGHRAGGGEVNPGSAYVVGESGPELLMGASGRIASNASMSRGPGGQGISNHYMIDARGQDPYVVENLRRALVAVHGSAVATSVQANADRMRRVPQHA